LFVILSLSKEKKDLHFNLVNLGAFTLCNPCQTQHTLFLNPIAVENPQVEERNEDFKRTCLPAGRKRDKLAKSF
jgi:hypothetical protein